MPQRRERRAELVRDRRHELGLQPGDREVALDDAPEEKLVPASISRMAPTPIEMSCRRVANSSVRSARCAER